MNIIRWDKSTVARDTVYEIATVMHGIKLEKDEIKVTGWSCCIRYLCSCAYIRVYYCGTCNIPNFDMICEKGGKIRSWKDRG